MIKTQKCSIWFFAMCTFIFISCKSADDNLKPLDLLSYGLPLKINAPENSVVEFDDMAIIKDVTVKGSDNYSIQIFASETNTLDLSVLKAEMKNSIEGGPFFSKIIVEEDDGFIYEKKIDENYTNYDFRQVKIRGDQKYIIQAGLSGKYTLEQVKKMYRSVQ